MAKKKISRSKMKGYLKIKKKGFPLGIKAKLKPAKRKDVVGFGNL